MEWAEITIDDPYGITFRPDGGLGGLPLGGTAVGGTAVGGMAVGGMAVGVIVGAGDPHAVRTSAIKTTRIRVFIFFSF